MKQYIALSLLVGACAVALFSLFGDNSYSRMRTLRKNIESQQGKNAELEEKVAKLQSEISALRFDDKKLENTARNELGLARPNELIFRFGSSLEEETQRLESEKISANNSNSDSEQAINASVLRKSSSPGQHAKLESASSVLKKGQ